MLRISDWGQIHFSCDPWDINWPAFSVQHLVQYLWIKQAEQFKGLWLHYYEKLQVKSVPVKTPKHFIWLDPVKRTEILTFTKLKCCSRMVLAWNNTALLLVSHRLPLQIAPSMLIKTCYSQNIKLSDRHSFYTHVPVLKSSLILQSISVERSCCIYT